jgi:hypothetical protein
MRICHKTIALHDFPETLQHDIRSYITVSDFTSIHRIRELLNNKRRHRPREVGSDLEEPLLEPEKFDNRLSAIDIEPKNDKILQQYICPISLAFPDNPVRCATTNQIYDLMAITDWLETPPSGPEENGNPLTREALTVSDLEDAPDIKEAIENRMAELEQQYNVHITAVRPGTVF